MVRNMGKLKIEGAIEAVLFCAGEPVPAKLLCEILDTDEKNLKKMIGYMADKMNQDESGMMILTLGDSYQMCSRPLYADYVRNALQNRRKVALSPAALEVLSIIAYHQPATRALIEQIRGVECGAVIANLCEKELIEERGRLDAPGRPLLYGTTPHFLRCFGLNDLSQLPPLPQAGEEKEEEELLALQ